MKHSIAITISVLLVVALAGRPAAGGQSPSTQGRPLTPAGELVLDVTTGLPAVGSLPVDFVRTPDDGGPDGKGRYLIAVNSGYGIQFSADTNHGQQSLAVIDLNAAPAPVVIQNVFFPSPQSAQVGVVFAPMAEPGEPKTYTLYVSGGVENKIWRFRFRPGAREPISPPSPGPDTSIIAPALSVAGLTNVQPGPRYNMGLEPVYPLGLALSSDGETLFVANNLADNLGIIGELGDTPTLDRVELGGGGLVYPYGVAALPGTNGSRTAKVYVSCWGTGTVAVIDPGPPGEIAATIQVARHPTAMVLRPEVSRLYVVNSNADSVSVIDTEADREIERIPVGLAEPTAIGASPEGLALSADGATLYVANAHSNTVAVVALSSPARGIDGEESEDGEDERDRSKVRGFIPTGRYPSAVAVAGGRIFVGNGKGTGVESSSLEVNQTDRAPNLPNRRFPPDAKGRGQYIASLVAGNIHWMAEPDELTLSRHTQQSMRNNGLLGPARDRLFDGPSPIEHVIYVLKENRTYDQVLGDLERTGDGRPADGDPSLAIFGAGEAARRPGGDPQNITPNHRALASRFGLLDRFFVNSEASPDGHNWSTAAFSSDYVDKGFRWSYSGRGRTYDYEGFNRLPSAEPRGDSLPLLPPPVTAADLADYMKRFIPYLQGGRDISEPETLYLWDAARRAGLTYRNYGEFIGTLSEADVEAFNENRRKVYPDTTRNQAAFPTKQSLEGHHSSTFRNYDLETPDSMTADSYREARKTGDAIRALISTRNPDKRFRGCSRIGEWLEEFRGFIAERESGQGEGLPAFSLIRLPNDHTAGPMPGMPSPQFMVADNDYALGLLVEAVSNSPYWRDTAIFVVEDDAQDGPDHVDAHRSVSLVVSAYNRPGALIHDFHNTVSIIRTMEMLLGIPPMNQLDATAVPVDIFESQPDLRPYQALLPGLALDNLMNPLPTDPQAAYWIERTLEQNLVHADMADPGVLNQILWYSVRGSSTPLPPLARLPAFDVMRAGIAGEAEEEDSYDALRRLRELLAGQ